MPTSITASNGNTYHLFQLSASGATGQSVKSFDEAIKFTVLRNELSDGYRSSLLFGSNTGVRRWSLRLPTLAHSSIGIPNVTDLNGSSVSREQYVWDLYSETQVTGEPFAIQSERNGQYYLVEFVDEELSYSGFKIKLYETGLNLKQVRVQGVTIYDLDLVPDVGVQWWYNESDSTGQNWSSVDTPAYGATMTGTGDVIFNTASQNSLDVIRLNSVDDTGQLALDLSGGIWREMFLVMKVREATFGQTSVVLANDGSDVLVGTIGTTEFAALPANTVYRLNGQLYEAGDYQAPMNTWGIVHLRNVGGFADTSIIFGQSQAAIETSEAEIDIAEVFASSGVWSSNVAREITEHLAVKWAVGG